MEGTKEFKFNKSNKIVNDSDEESSDSTDIDQYEEYPYSGLILNNYLLLKRIGHGNNATVWVAYNPKIGDYGSYFAIKVQESANYSDGKREVEILNKINNHCEAFEKEINCIRVLDNFIAYYKKNKFACTVYYLYAGSLSLIINYGKYRYGMPIPAVKRIAKQLLNALHHLHTKLHVVHTDIKPANVLIKGILNDHKAIIESFSKFNYREKFMELKKKLANKPQLLDSELENLGISAVESIKDMDLTIYDKEIMDNNNDIEDFDDDEEDEDISITDFSLKTGNLRHKRKQSVDDMNEYIDDEEKVNLEKCYKYSEVLKNVKSKDKETIIDDKYIDDSYIDVIDFGNSYFITKLTKHEIQDRFYRAPEIILNLKYGYACDIWSFSCVIYELLTGFLLFNPENNDDINQDLHHLFLIEKLVGNVPTNMKKSSPRRKFLFDKDLTIHGVEMPECYGLVNLLVNQHLFDKEEAIEISNFLMQGLEIDPSKRATAEQMMKSSWLN